MLRITPLLLVASVSLLAAEASGPQFFSAAELKSYEKKLAPKVKDNVALEEIIRSGNYFSVVARVQAAMPAEMHENWSDVYMIISGTGALEVGGTLDTPKTTAPGELRAPAIQGGTQHKLSPGDVIHIPAKTPHRVLQPDGQITYLVFKVKN